MVHATNASKSGDWRTPGLEPNGFYVRSFCFSPSFLVVIEICGVDQTSMRGLTLANCTLPTGFCAQGEGVGNMAPELNVDDVLGSLE